MPFVAAGAVTTPALFVLLARELLALVDDDRERRRRVLERLTRRMADAGSLLTADRTVPLFAFDAHDVLVAWQMRRQRAATVVVALLLLALAALLVVLIIVDGRRRKRLILRRVDELHQHVELRAAHALGGLPERPLQQPRVVGGELGVVERESRDQLEHGGEHAIDVAALVHLTQPSHGFVDGDLRRNDLLLRHA